MTGPPDPLAPNPRPTDPRLGGHQGILAPYACRPSESKGRRVPEAPHAYRSAFQRDRDRIVHSAAFRRLEHKTQVFVSSRGDHYRTRLTHTLEATQIARTLARALGLNEDLTEAVALAHDLGHAPFGHAGGEALQEVMQEHGGFDHNRQSLRVVDVLEQRYARFAGLNLSYEVRESIVKHGHDESTKTPEEGERRVPELADFDPTQAPLLEAQLVDHCDSIAYDTHDLDDGLRSGLLTLEQVHRLGLWQRAEAAVKRRQGALFLDHPDLARHAVVRRIVDIVATDLIETTRASIAREGVTSVAGVRAHGRYLVGISDELRAERREIQRFLFENLYRHHQVMRIWRLAKHCLTRLFRAYNDEPLLLPPRWRKWTGEVGVQRAVCDYLAGMTDRFAEAEVRRLFEPFQAFDAS